MSGRWRTARADSGLGLEGGGACEGRDDSKGETAHCTHVSIHAPARGATSAGDQRVGEDLTFQFTRPRGARQMRFTIKRLLPEFQFTRPHGARLSRTTRMTTACRFNSRAREGRDIALHPPCRMRSCFNSRAREGRDLHGVVGQDVERRFQFTRPRGTRPSCRR